MKKNIETTLDRGDKLDELDMKADRLESHASAFNKKAGQARRNFCTSRRCHLDCGMRLLGRRLAIVSLHGDADPTCAGLCVAGALAHGRL